MYSYLIALQHGFAAFVVERLSHRVRRQVFLLGQIEGGVRINVFGIFGYSFQGAHLATGRLLPRLPHGRVVLFPLLHVVLVLQRRLGLRARIVRSPRPFRVCNQRDSLVSERQQRDLYAGIEISRIEREIYPDAKPFLNRFSQRFEPEHCYHHHFIVVIGITEEKFEPGFHRLPFKVFESEQRTSVD